MTLLSPVIGSLNTFTLSFNISSVCGRERTRCAMTLGPSRGRKTCQRVLIAGFFVFLFLNHGDNSNNNTLASLCACVPLSAAPRLGELSPERDGVCLLRTFLSFGLCSDPALSLCKFILRPVMWSARSLTYCILDDTCTAFLMFKELESQTCLPH